MVDYHAQRQPRTSRRPAIVAAAARLSPSRQDKPLLAATGPKSGGPDTVALSAKTKGSS